MSDTHAACMNFVNALEKIPGIIAQYEECTAKLKADVPTLEGIMTKKWGKEDELKQLKSDLALDRKIQAEIAPKQENKEDGQEIKRDNTQQTAQTIKVPTPSPDNKKSMVAEPTSKYNEREPLSSRIIIGGCGVTLPGGFRAARRKL